MSMFRRAVAAVCLSAIASPLFAIDKWTVTDLGSARTETICVEAASESFLSFSNIFGASKILRASWTVYGYGLNRENHDAVITCAFSTANATRATLVVYSDNSVVGGLISNRIAQHFHEHSERLEAEWLGEAYDRFGF